MTLADLANFICGTISQTEATDVAACKGYLTQRHKMMWQDQMWKDSLVEYTQTITSQGYDPTVSVWLPTRQILLVAPIIDQVVAIRSQDRHMGVQSSEYYYRRDFDVFNNSGVMAEFRLLSPAVWDFDTALAIGAWATATPDIGSQLLVTTMGSDGITETATQVSLQVAGQSLGSVLTIESATKGVSSGVVNIGKFVPNAFAFLVIYSGPGVLSISLDSNIGDAVRTGSGTFVFTTPADGVQIGTTLYFWLNGVPTPVPSYTIPLAGTLTLDNSGNFLPFVAQPDVAETPIVTLKATDTAAKPRQRVQLIGGVTDGQILRILGKRTCPTFASDTDTPAITGSENCLIEFAMADMYRRERQVGKATATAQAGAALLTQLIKEQTSQQAHKKRFVPSDGFGGVNSFVGGGWFGGGTFPF